MTIQEAARVLLDAMQRNKIDPFDAVNPDIEALAFQHSGKQYDAVVLLETADEFMRAALRAIMRHDSS